MQLISLICNRWKSFVHSQLFLCKHQNVIKTNRSGFLISFSHLLPFVCLALESIRKKLHRGWVFIFIFIMYDLVHNICIHAVSRFTSTTGQAEAETWVLLVERRKHIENESLWRFVRADVGKCCSLITSRFYDASVFHSTQQLNEKLKLYYCGAFVCSRNKKIFLPRRRQRVRCD